MSVWKDEADFMKDIESISDFFIAGAHNNPLTKFTFKSKKQNRIISTPWYDESDSDDERLAYSFGRGRDSAECSRNPGEELDHHEVLRDIRMQVRNTVGNRYNNEVLESYYNVCKDEDDSTSEAPAVVPEEIPATKTSPIDKKCSVAESIESSTAKLTSNDHESIPVQANGSCNSSSSSSPKIWKKNGNHTGHFRNNRKFGARNQRNSDRRDKPHFYSYNGSENEVDIRSKAEFPPLK